MFSWEGGGLSYPKKFRVHSSPKETHHFPQKKRNFQWCVSFETECMHCHDRLIWAQIVRFLLYDMKLLRVIQSLGEKSEGVYLYILISGFSLANDRCKPLDIHRGVYITFEEKVYKTYPFQKVMNTWHTPVISKWKAGNLGSTGTKRKMTYAIIY